MTSSNFPVRGLSETDRYLLRRAALDRGVSANALIVDLLRRELDVLLPGAREAYERRTDVAEQALRRQGVDPDSAEYAKVRAWTRAMLARADQLRRNQTA
ncbi:hypothetical protein ACIBJI_24095 [Nocardia sp. NPDC050408]|uniref:hypothetical protein n=1 Tax=Nocardia sp. NPDC050408 TaxID=3364319 RepID=UPI0037A5DA4B